MKEKKRKEQVDTDTKKPNKPGTESPAAFPKVDDEAVRSDPVKRRAPEPKKPGERLEDYLG
ncbi:MAG TPA: hypothetical protein VMM76_02145 [Pirellulaceae bacterium]|nr:hypothetical protein [Pirellulaceae bacterium]